MRFRSPDGFPGDGIRRDGKRIYFPMSGKWNGKRIFHIFVLALAGIALLDFLFLHGDGGEEEKGGNRFSWKRSLAEKLGQEVTGVWLPAISFAGQDGMGSGSLLKEILGQ